MTRMQAVGLAMGLALGFLLSFAAPSMAARNGSGTYSLPNSGGVTNPVVTGTTITSTWANGTLNDIASEITNSLDRGGRGAMTAPLQLASGDATAPGLTFSSDTNTGIYRAGADNIAITTGGTQRLGMSTTATALYLPLSVSVAPTDTNAIVGSGYGSGAGVYGAGGATGYGVIGFGGTGGAAGVYGLGYTNSGGQGGQFVGAAVTDGGTGGTGATLTAGNGATGGVGLNVSGGTGTSTGGIGIIVTGGSGGGSGGDAISVQSGDIDMDAVTPPSSTTAVKNSLTPLNIPKAWAYVTGTGATPTISAGFNITSVACATKVITLTFAQAFASANFACIASGPGSSYFCGGIPGSSSTWLLACYGHDGVQTDLCAVSNSSSVVCFGDQ